MGATYTSRALPIPSRAHSKKVRNPEVEVAFTQSGREGPQRYSPERAYRPRVPPPSVEDKDACAIYASVRNATRRPATSLSSWRSNRFK